MITDVSYQQKEKCDKNVKVFFSMFKQSPKVEGHTENNDGYIQYYKNIKS